MAHIKPGGLGPFPPNDFAGSMAQEIETQLNLLLAADGLPLLPLDNSPETRDRRRLFVAIARGVVKHLVDNRDSIRVRMTFPEGTQVSPTFTVDGL